MNVPPALFPNLTAANHTDTSPPDHTYNCHAWALGFTDRWFDARQWWPQGVNRGETLPYYRRAYESVGFRLSAGWDVEEGIEKIAIYEANGKVTHTARLLDDGQWTSKMGKREDITHGRGALDGPKYGHIVIIMRRPRPQEPPV
jgi:hypothetical protein